MVRKLVFCVVILLLFSLIVSNCGAWKQNDGGSAGTQTQTTDTQQAITDEIGDPDEAGDIAESQTQSVFGVTGNDFRAVWVATVFNLDFPSSQNLSVSALKREIDDIAAHTAELGLNAVIFQVRPTGDAFYQSDIFPWSQWLTGTQGLGVTDFDPLAYWIEACHENGLELHAWLNPYRIIHTNTNSSDPDSLAPDNPVRLHPELAVGWTDSGGNKGLFLDPGLPEARALVIDGVAEIVTKYDVDGIHIDDYFYPGTNFNDEASFNLYGNGMSLDDWRRENVNELIRGIGAVIRELNEELDKNVRWGVSPTAIWLNGSSDPRGVPGTSGQEAYSAVYADTRRWVMEEWVDYICPQIYWYIGFDIADFESILDWWIRLCRGYGVDLYIGHAAYREDQDDQAPNWRGEIVRQLEMTTGSDIVKGNVFYRFYSLAGAVGSSIRDFYATKDNAATHLPVMVLDTLTVGTPYWDTAIIVAQNASAGFNITGTSDPGTPLFMNGREITNRTIEGFFSVFATLDAGENVFTFSQAGQKDVTRRITRNPPGPPAPPASPPTVSQVTTPTYATVMSDTAWAFPSNSSAGGSDWVMSRRQTDRVIAESSNGFVKLSCGMWISRESVVLSTKRDVTEDVLKSGVYRAGKDYDVIAWKSDVFVAAYAGFDGRVLTVNFGMHTQPPPLNLPADLSETIFESVHSGKNGDTPYHAFTIRDDVKFEGCYTDYENGEFRLYLKKRASLAEGNEPLSGITIVLDPGHGGEDFGAIGPMGRDLPEKDICLVNSRKLAERLIALGATVHMTRDMDADISLQERVSLNFQVKPDLFISLHVNSIAETTNATNIRGFTVWYKNPGSAEFAQTILDNMYRVNMATNRLRKLNQSNLFVCRPQWAPAILLEASFIVNIDDFVWLIDPMQQDKMADATVTAILDYFTPD